MRISDWSSDVCSSDLLDAGLGGVVGVVEADGDKLADAAGAGAEPRRALDRGQALEIELLELLERVRQQHRAGDVGDMTGQVAQRALAVDGAGLFLADAPIAQQFHEFLPSRSEAHTSELQSLMRIPSALLCLKKNIAQPIK